MEKLSPPIRDFVDVRSAIIESARIRRHEHIYVNYFRAPEAVVRLHVIAESVNDPRYTDEERATAAQLLSELDQRQKDIIKSLPAIEEGATVAERFVAFYDHDDFRTLDLDRSEHADGDWTTADSMQLELDDLLENIGMLLKVDKHDLSPKTCTMNFHAITEEDLDAGFIWLTRNTKKASVDDEIFINKRSEFILDLNKLYPALSNHIKQKIRAHISGNAYMAEEEFEALNYLVASRDTCLTPIYSTLYSYRESPSDDRGEPKFTAPQLNELENDQPKYPALAAAWVKRFGNGEDPRRSEYKVVPDELADDVDLEGF